MTKFFNQRAVLTLGLCFFIGSTAASPSDILAEGNKIPKPTLDVEEMAKEKSLSNWPCLSYSLPCGSISTRPVVKKMLSGELSGDAKNGKKLALSRQCVACHHFNGSVQAGTVGPDLSHYGSLGRTDAETYAIVFDRRSVNPDTVMPPFGTNGLWTDQEIRDVVAFLQSSK